MEPVTTLAVAAFVTKVVDTIRNAFDTDDSFPKWVWNVSAFLIGIVSAYVAVAAGVEIIDAGDNQWATGLVIGGLASGFHEVFDRLSP